MGVLFQAFYWNCPQEESQDGTWWNFLAGKIPELRAGRIHGAMVAGAARVEGSEPRRPRRWATIDPYDSATWATSTRRPHPDLVRQPVPTDRAGNARARRHMHVYADLVIDHDSGGDRRRTRSIDR